MSYFSPSRADLTPTSFLNSSAAVANGTTALISAGTNVNGITIVSGSIRVLYTNAANSISSLAFLMELNQQLIVAGSALNLVQGADANSVGGGAYTFSLKSGTNVLQTMTGARYNSLDTGTLGPSATNFIAWDLAYIIR